MSIDDVCDESDLGCEKEEKVQKRAANWAVRSSRSSCLFRIDLEH